MLPSIEHFKELYDNSLVRALLQATAIAHPVVGVIDAAMVGFINERSEKRTRIIFDKLNQGDYTLTPAEIYNNDLLYAFFTTLRYSQNCRTDEKAEQFAELLSKLYAGNLTMNDYENQSSFLNELTESDFVVAACLLKWEKPSEKETRRDVQQISTYWKPFLEEVQQILSVDKEEIHLIIDKLDRKGVVNQARLWSANPERYCQTTKLFQVLHKNIQANSVSSNE